MEKTRKKYKAAMIREKNVNPVRVLVASDGTNLIFGLSSAHFSDC